MPIFSKKSLKYIFIGIILLAIFYIFSFLVKEDIFTRFDFDMTVRIQNKIPKRIDPYFSYFSLLGSFEITGIALVIFALIRRKIKSILLAGIFGFMHVVEIIGKAFLDHPVTPFMFHRYSFDFVFPTGYVQPGGSYPSGHAMRTSFLAVLLIFVILKSKRFSKTIKLLSCIGIILFFLVMVFSRISLGEHWTTDVIGGSLLGTAFGFLSLVLI